MPSVLYGLMASLVVTSALVVPLAGSSTPAAPRETPAIEPATFQVDATHSKALFRVKHLRASHFYGRFNTVTGSFTYEPGGDGVPSLDVAVPIESVDTGSEQLDNHLKSPDFFNGREFEMMTFKSRSAKKTAEDTFAVTGDLTIHGVTKELTATVELIGATELAPRMGFRCGFETTFVIDRTDFGMEYGVARGMVGEDVKIIVSLEGIRE